MPIKMYIGELNVLVKTKKQVSVNSRRKSNLFYIYMTHCAMFKKVSKNLFSKKGKYKKKSRLYFYIYCVPSLRSSILQRCYCGHQAVYQLSKIYSSYIINLVPFDQYLPISLAPKHHSTICFYEFDFFIFYLSFCAWLTYFNIMSSRLSQVTKYRISFFQTLIFHFIQHIFFIHLFIGHFRLNPISCLL